MVPRTSISSLLLFSVPLLSTLVAAATAPTKCYYLDGSTDQNAGYRCNNATTGHSSCCAAGGLCYSNGVCQQSNNGVQDYLRVGCTDRTWKDSACLDQCTICEKHVSYPPTVADLLQTQMTLQPEYDSAMVQ
jgi:hypothetical protein